MFSTFMGLERSTNCQRPEIGRLRKFRNRGFVKFSRSRSASLLFYKIMVAYFNYSLQHKKCIIVGIRSPPSKISEQRGKRQMSEIQIIKLVFGIFLSAGSAVLLLIAGV